MRDAFRAIVSGWMLRDDFDDLTDRIERAAEWSRTHPLEPDERATITMMIECQFVRADREDRFPAFGFDGPEGEP